MILSISSKLQIKINFDLNINIIFILFAEELKEHFVQYGEITNISLKTDPATGRSRGFAFIIFKSVDGLNNVKYLYTSI